jgi:hypothetical protein
MIFALLIWPFDLEEVAEPPNPLLKSKSVSYCQPREKYQLVLTLVLLRQYGETAMDFIERWFGVSPDGGDGTLELLYISAEVLIVVRSP